MNTFKRIAINTGGGDAPGVNAVIHAAHTHGWEIHGIRDGFDGLLHPENYPDGGVIKRTRTLVRNIALLGGTKVAEHFKRRTAGRGHQYSIIVVAEGAKPLGGGVALKEAASAGKVERFGGAGEIAAGQLRELTGKETRAVVLGHLLRGGQPTSFDRSLGLTFGAAAVRVLVEGQDGVMVAVNPPRLDYVPLRVATAKLKPVAADDYGVMTARTLDT